MNISICLHMAMCQKQNYVSQLEQEVSDVEVLLPPKAVCAAGDKLTFCSLNNANVLLHPICLSITAPLSTEFPRHPPGHCWASWAGTPSAGCHQPALYCPLAPRVWMVASCQHLN